ncbi:hypothetical protein RJ639_043809 [Escallonia herrerae]|uniref:Protein ABIL1 n=1 Tax=Escallonia herrerae TaxID=1293975 RepID=A0AA88WBE9_9ASTE|nr:hypothetical protein RJ639_043809 [Escallonia herrerae]
MEVERPRQDNPAMIFDEASMEQSKSFVKALQELKNLRPQLYSAADYCEKSYLHSEQKQMVLDNLKDYAVRALVNAVDHLGTVAYKLTDLLEQQTLDVSSMELKISCLDQSIVLVDPEYIIVDVKQLLTCQTFTVKEGLRQQQLLAIIPRHHKHYILPNSVNKKVHFSPHIQTDARQSHIQTRPRLFPGGTPAAKTLSWHLASETQSTLKGNRTFTRLVTGTLAYTLIMQLYENAEEGAWTKSSAAYHQLSNAGPVSGAAMQTLGVARRLSDGCAKIISLFSLAGHLIGLLISRESMALPGLISPQHELANTAANSEDCVKFDPLDGSKPLTAFRSFDNPTRREVVRTPIRSKSMLSAFFVKQKTLKTGAVS